VTGGNVSFYNETKGRAIYPTPVIGMLGSVGDPRDSVGLAFRTPGDAIVVLGATEPDDFGGSEYAKVVNGTIAGRPPKLDVTREKALQAVLIEGARAGSFSSAHDCSAGGLAVALAESALAGDLGFSIDSGPLGDFEPHRLLFSESPSRAVVSCPPERVEALRQLADRYKVPFAVAGKVETDVFDLGTFRVEADVVREVFDKAFEAAMTTKVS
jgi:phosphoribosylformylglycinamidine synthase